MVYLGLKEWNNNGLKTNLCKISWGVLVYNLWWQRNIIRNGSPPRLKESSCKMLCGKSSVELTAKLSSS
jgi:hypothetical protein